MQLLQGINRHLLTSRADPLNPGEKLKVLWMIVETDRKEEESEKKKSLRVWAALSLMGRLWGHYELTINSLCWFPEWGIETNCLSAIQLRSSVPPDKKKYKNERKKEKEAEAVKVNYPYGCFWNISFLFCRHRPYGKTPIHLHALIHLYTTQWSRHFREPDIWQKQSHFKIVIFQQLFLLLAV